MGRDQNQLKKALIHFKNYLVLPSPGIERAHLTLPISSLQQVSELQNLTVSVVISSLALIPVLEQLFWVGNAVDFVCLFSMPIQKQIHPNIIRTPLYLDTPGFPFILCVPDALLHSTLQVSSPNVSLSPVFMIARRI